LAQLYIQKPIIAVAVSKERKDRERSGEKREREDDGRVGVFRHYNNMPFCFTVNQILTSFKITQLNTQINRHSSSQSLPLLLLILLFSLSLYITSRDIRKKVLA